MFQTILLIITNFAARFIKCSVIVGSPMLFFSMSNAIMPINAMLGGYFGLFISVACAALYSILIAKKAFFLTFFGVISLLRVPTIIASIFLKTESRVLLYVVLFGCITGFLMHPEGYLAAPYTLYWILPFITTQFFKNALWIRFLNTTLLQHAVGSVIFLYKTNMSCAYWYSLIPIVAIERLLFASGMFVAYHALLYTYNFVLHAQRSKTKAVHNQ